MQGILANRWMAALLAACLMAGCLGLSACGGSGELKDGTYTGESSHYEGDAVDGAGYGVATVTIKDGAITACTFETYELDGTKKDENYGKSLAGNENKYFKAQNAVNAAGDYAKALVDKGDINAVDTISGATVNHDQFREAVEDALGKARA